MNNSIIYVVIVSLAIGAFIGRKTMDIPEPTIITEVLWEKGETIVDSIPYPVPYEVVRCEERIVEIPIPVDTSALYATWSRYHEQKKYNLDFSNDTVGVFKVDLTVSQNSVSEAISTIEPYTRTIHTQEILEMPPKTQFYVMGGVSTNLQTFKLQGGVDFQQRYMLGVSAMSIGGNPGYTLDFGVKF